MDLGNLLSIIDGGADSITRDVAGNRTEEYRTAEAQAQAFKDTGYEGQAGEYVTCWSAAKGWTDQEAADDILQTAAAWRGAQALIRAQRLTLKERAKSGDDLDSILQEWLAFDKEIRSQLGI